jgi:hypothetical protein
MLFREIIAVYSEDHTTPINILWGQNVQLLDKKAGGILGKKRLSRKNWIHVRPGPRRVWV